MATFLCTVAIALGFGQGICAEEEVQQTSPLPPQQLGMYDVVEEVPEPEPAKPVPNFPPVVVYKEPQAVSAPPPVQPVEETTPEETKEPDPVSPAVLRAMASIQARTGAGPKITSLGNTAVQEWEEVRGEPAPESKTPVVNMPAIQTTNKVATESGTSGYQGPRLVASQPVDNTRLFHAGRFIEVVLETSLNTQLDGTINLITTAPQWGAHGTEPLIPKGSKLFCSYGDVKLAQTRFALTCDRMLIAETMVEVFSMSGAGGDIQGRSGLTGEIDTRFMDKYGAAFTLAGIAGAVRLSTALAGDGTDSQLGTTLSEGSSELSQQLGEINARILEQTIDLEAIITSAQGTVFNIRPVNDLYFPEPTS